MKRAIAFILILSLMIIPINTSAANEVFVGVNNIMLPLDNAMPFSSGGVWYIDYNDFTQGDLGVSASYNKDLGTAVLYNWDSTLVFNVGKGTAYKEGGTQFNQKSFYRNGTVYVPAAFVAEQLGITFSYLSEVSTLRLRSNSGMSDTMFVYIAKNRIPDLIAQYNQSKLPETPSSSPDNTEKDNTEEDHKNNVVYITINVKSSDKLREITTVLDNYNVPATLFISKSAMSDDNLLRKLCAGRHSVGIYSSSTSEASQINEELYAKAKRKTRLLRSEDKIADASVNGYRQWGAHIDARNRNSTQINNLLNNRANTVLVFDDSDTSVTRLKSVLAHINKQKFTVRVIDVLSTPVAP